MNLVSSKPSVLVSISVGMGIYQIILLNWENVYIILRCLCSSNSIRKSVLRAISVPKRSERALSWYYNTETVYSSLFLVVYSLKFSLSFPFVHIFEKYRARIPISPLEVRLTIAATWDKSLLNLVNYRPQTPGIYGSNPTWYEKPKPNPQIWFSYSTPVPIYSAPLPFESQASGPGHIASIDPGDANTLPARSSRDSQALVGLRTTQAPLNSKAPEPPILRLPSLRRFSSPSVPLAPNFLT